ncbi:MAG TPA: hypothetical protein VGO25_13615 [Rhodanobacteraceae bacterium]|jgi:hypothetical protein|nr:hypothetical protein [Rhodanobacteraceae bacterium]
MKTAAKLLAAVMVASFSASASAACHCSCVNAQIEAVCTLPSDLPPVCAPRACTSKAPSTTLVNQTRVGPNATKQCHETLTLNPQTGSYISKQICQ